MPAPARAISGLAVCQIAYGGGREAPTDLRGSRGQIPAVLSPAQKRVNVPVAEPRHGVWRSCERAELEEEREFPDVVQAEVNRSPLHYAVDAAATSGYLFRGPLETSLMR